MAKGDHIYRRMKNTAGTKNHHGIDCGDGTVIHYDGKMICRVSKHEFADGELIQTRPYNENCDHPEVVLQRAISKLGEQKYHFICNNCEHFAYYCKTGKSKSEQVNQALAYATSAVSAGGTQIAAQAATKVAAEAAKQSLNPISKVLVNVGIKQSPTVAGRVAVGIAGFGGLVSGVATDVVVNKIMEDDKHLPKQEREARKNARQAGQIASTIGGIAGTVAAGAIGGTTAIAAAVAAPAVLGLGVAVGMYYLSNRDEKG